MTIETWRRKLTSENLHADNRNEGRRICSKSIPHVIPQCDISSDQKDVSSFLEGPFLALSFTLGVPSPWRGQEQFEE